MEVLYAAGTVDGVEPVFLPDGHRFLFRVGHGALDAQGTYLSSLDDQSSTRLFNLGVNVAYGAGRILFVRAGTLFAQAFDVEAPTAVRQARVLATTCSRNVGQTSGPSEHLGLERGIAGVSAARRR